ncbi:MAG: hypothetical protein JW784_04485 [Candidatus Cloacimonetes bacterium]|nr:hypothetical protein [Candidatus Cloacimonadota bacterium]
MFKLFNQKIQDRLKSSRYRISEYNFAAGLEGNPELTDLTLTLEQLTEVHDLTDVKSLFLLSDGWFKDEDIRIIDQLNLPINTIEVDFPSEDADLQVTSLKVNRQAYLEELTPIIVEVNALDYQGEALLSIYSRDKQLASRKVDFSTENLQQIVFDLEFTEPGLTPLQARLEALDHDETYSSNNSLSDAVQVLQSRSVIAIISDQPSWDAKFMIDALRPHQRWETRFLLKTDRLYQGEMVIQWQELLPHLAVIILINNKNLRLDPEDTGFIRNFLQQGGGLIFMGRFHPDLADILPVMPSGITDSFQGLLSLTEDSQQYDTFQLISQQELKNIPPVSYYYINPKLQARILATIDNEEQSPALLFDYSGEGRILYCSFHDLWKWQLRSSDSVFNELISGLCQWIGQQSTDRFFVNLQRNEFSAGEMIDFQVQAFNELLAPARNLTVKMTLQSVTGEITNESYLTETLKGYELRFRIDIPGEYFYSVETETFQQETKGSFLVVPADWENRNLGINKPLLAYISERTGGNMFNPDELDEFRPEIIPERKLSQKYEIPLYRKWYLITLFLVAFSLELYLRKRWGLL